MWTFISKSSCHGKTHDNKDLYEPYRFQVFDDREPLGIINYTHNSKREVVYCMTNERIANSRERGCEVRTKDTNKALKIIGKTFGAKTIAERVEESVASCERNINKIFQDKKSTFDYPYEVLASWLSQHIMKDYDTFFKIAVENGLDPSDVKDLPEKYEEFQVTRKINKCSDNGKGVVVTIHGNDYAVQKRGNDLTIYGTETLPEWIKRGVGMLKLIEKHHMIANVGYKLNEQSFFVIEEGA